MKTVNILFLFVLVGIIVFSTSFMKTAQNPNRDKTARERWTPYYNEALKPLGAKVGDPVFIRILKEERKLTLFIRPEGEEVFHVVKSFPVLALSGGLGPKMREGDAQGPEGFYATKSTMLNPNSSYHLSFNIGYPNAYDQALKRTGTFIMVHGKKVSIGCFAIGDEGIEQVYTFVAAALSAGQREVPIHIYPFALTDEKLEARADSEHIAFWRELKPFWDFTEENKKPPAVGVANNRYILK